MNPTCTVDSCGTPTDGYLCHTHTTRLRAALRTTADLWPETLTALARLTRTSTHTPRRAGDPPLPWDPHVSETRWVVTHTIHAWARVVADTRRVALPPDDIPLTCAWLHHHTTWAAHQTWAADLHDEITTCAWRVLTPTVDRHPERTYLGPCPSCGRDLHAHPAATTTDCPCGTTTDTATQRRRLLTAAADEIRPAAWVSKCVALGGITLRDTRIRQWKRRGHLEVRAVDPSGRPLYRVGDVLALLQTR